ncbi:hypothetical protein DFH09DRAFT_1315131 [Mycena vulgaris]|nr:hypothetical protein DFH09DRAFT_1315131 [Mycena vulgaris]
MSSSKIHAEIVLLRSGATPQCDFPTPKWDSSIKTRRLLALSPNRYHTYLSIVNLANLQYDNSFWQSTFSQGQSKGLNLEAKLHLVFSLMIFLSISTRQLLHWLFTTRIPDVSHRISHFMGFFSTESSPEAQFGPQMLFSLWRDEKRWPKAQKYIRDMTIPCAHELALQDSDRMISSPFLRVRLRTLTIEELRNLLHPTRLIEIVKGLAPFTWGVLHTFCASPNRTRKRQKTDEDAPMPPSGTETEAEDWADDPNDDPDLEAGESDPAGSANLRWSEEYPGFSRNPVFVILLTICMLAFVRNRATNVLPLLLGLFFKISGTSSRVILMLSNAGICVSSQTVERLKVRITEDAIQLAVNLMTSGQVFFTIFDNINVFLRKSQQRLSNSNDMINATNCAIVGIT